MACHLIYFAHLCPYYMHPFFIFQLGLFHFSSHTPHFTYLYPLSYCCWVWFYIFCHTPQVDTYTTRFYFGLYCLQTPLLFPDYFLYHHVYWPHSPCMFYCLACFIFYLLHSHFYCTHPICFMHLTHYLCTLIFVFSTFTLFFAPF